MKLKVTSFYLHGSKLSTRTAVPYNGIAVEEFEPDCPFCGKRLVRARCSCVKFKVAFDKVVLEYALDKEIQFCDQHPAALRIEDVQRFDPQNCIIEEISAQECLMSCFNESRVFKHCEISLAELEKNQLSFWLKLFSKNNIYHITIKNFVFTPPKRKIYFYTLSTEAVPNLGRKIPGNYHLESKIKIKKKLSYRTFLERLKEN